MTSAGAWWVTLKRLPQRALERSPLGKRIPILPGLTRLPEQPWQRPPLRIIEEPRRVEFTLQLAGAQVDSIEVRWDDEAQILTVWSRARSSTPTPSALDPLENSPSAVDRDWYTEIGVGSDLDGSRAEAFFKDGTLRVRAPRIDTRPMTGLPLFLSTEAPPPWSLALAT